MRGAKTGAARLAGEQDTHCRASSTTTKASKPRIVTLAALAPTPAPLRSTITESTVLTGERDTRWSSSATTKASKPHTNYAYCLGSFALSHATSTQRTRPDAPPRRNSSCRRRKELPRARPVLILLPAAHQLQATLAANLYTPPARSTTQDKPSAHAAPRSTSASKPSTHPVPCHPAATEMMLAERRRQRETHKATHILCEADRRVPVMPSAQGHCRDQASTGVHRH